MLRTWKKYGLANDETMNSTTNAMNGPYLSHSIFFANSPNPDERTRSRSFMFAVLPR